TLDGLWKDHLLQMDHLREGIGLRGYGQKDPLLEYKREGFGLFRQMMGQLTTDVLQKLFRVRIQEEQVARASQEVANLPFKHQPMQMSHQETGSFRQPAPSSPLAAGPQTTGSTAPSYPKVGRNDPCPCGSGRKYKKCHGG
ncbi:MAG: SEC-C domain-containing protein, partial [Deltaproteobacteria bacterium]|nr:SEC-C domain-containing protein [Deltaproteobacteria bacterium]